jgi:protein-S-isoprenylcysteine O-methyltransferase Ste14
MAVRKTAKMKLLFALVSYAMGLSSLIAYFGTIRFGLDKNPDPFSWALVARDFAIFLIFPLQHSILIRPGMKKFLQKIFSPHLERSFYVATSGFALWMVLLFWKPFGPLLYELRGGLIFDVVFGSALVFIIWSTIQMDHSTMFGLKQGYLAWKGKDLPKKCLETRGIYGVVRHPITSLLIVALWSQASMTAGRLLFNLLFSTYAIAGTIFEERDLIKHFGQEYVNYTRRVPAFIPRAGALFRSTTNTSKDAKKRIL